MNPVAKIGSKMKIDLEESSLFFCFYFFKQNPYLNFSYKLHRSQ
jgi:hypothetical protein